MNLKQHVTVQECVWKTLHASARKTIQHHRVQEISWFLITASMLLRHRPRSGVTRHFQIRNESNVWMVIARQWCASTASVCVCMKGGDYGKPLSTYTGVDNNAIFFLSTRCRK